MASEVVNLSDVVGAIDEGVLVSRRYGGERGGREEEEAATTAEE